MVTMRPPFGLWSRRAEENGRLKKALNGKDFAQLTTRLVQPFLDSLQLSLKLLILNCQPTVSILQQSLKVLDPLVSGQQLAFSDASFLLQGRVLVDKLIWKQICDVSLMQK